MTAPTIRLWPAGPRRADRDAAPPEPGGITRPDRLIALALALLAFAVYLATAPLRLQSIDELAVFSVARSLAARGSVDADGMLWSAVAAGEGAVVAPGRNGHLYALKDVGPSLLDAPLVWLGTQTGVGGLKAALLLSPILTALAAGAVYLLGRALRVRRGAALLAGLTFAFASLAWPYAGTLFTQPLAALALTLAALAATRVFHTGSLRAALGSGLAMGLAGLSATPLWMVAAPIFVYMLPPGGRLRVRVRRGLPAAVAFGMGAGVVLLGQAAYNWLRFGSPLDTGHLHTSGVALIPANLLPGLVGQLVSLPRGIVWFAPFALLVPVGAALGWRTQRRFVWLALAVSLMVAGLYSMWFQWWGGLVWGPRFLLPLMPFWALLAAPLYERIAGGPAVAQWAVGLLLIASAGVQALAALLDVLPAQADLHVRLLAGRPWPALADPAYLPYRALAGQVRAGAWGVPWLRAGRADPAIAAALAVLIGLAVLWLLALWRGRVRGLGRPLLAQAVGSVAVAALLLARTPPPPADFALGSGPLPPGLRAAAQLVEARTPREDGLALLLPGSYPGWADATSGAREEVNFFVEQPLRDESARMLEALTARHRRVWVVSQGVEDGSAENAVEAWLAANGFAGEALHLLDGVRLVPFNFNPPVTPLALVEQPFRAESGGEVVLQGLLWAFERNDYATWLNVETHWAAPAGVPVDVTISTQVFDAAGQRRLAQLDAQPQAGFAPSGRWASGEVVIDRRQIALPPDLPPGPYLLIVGVYDAGSGQGFAPVGGEGGGVGYVVEMPPLDGSPGAR